MTILEAIQTAIDNLEAVNLPIRDADNATRVRNALTLLDALKETALKQENEAESQDEVGSRK